MTGKFCHTAITRLHFDCSGMGCHAPCHGTRFDTGLEVGKEFPAVPVPVSVLVQNMLCWEAGSSLEPNGTINRSSLCGIVSFQLSFMKGSCKAPSLLGASTVGKGKD